MRNDNDYRAKRKRRSMTEHVKRLMTLKNDLSCARKDIRAFLRGVAHAFGRHTWVEADNKGQETEGPSNVDGELTEGPSNIDGDDAHNGGGNNTVFEVAIIYL